MAPLRVMGHQDRCFMVDPLSYFSFQPVDMCYPVCTDGAYKRTLAADQRVAHVVVAVGSLYFTVSMVLFHMSYTT